MYRESIADDSIQIKSEVRYCQDERGRAKKSMVFEMREEEELEKQDLLISWAQLREVM